MTKRQNLTEFHINDTGLKPRAGAKNSAQSQLLKEFNYLPSTGILWSPRRLS